MLSDIHYEPYGPYGIQPPPIPDMSELTPEEQNTIHVTAALYGCGVFLVAFIMALVICMFFSSCSTHKEVTSVEHHRIENLMQRMDSVISNRQVIQQDSSWRELVMNQFQSIRERNDTSHTFIVDTTGRVIKETLIIRTERESNSETERKEREMMVHRLEVMDSTLNVMQIQFSHIDSLMQLKQTVIEKTVPAKLNIWQQARIHLANIILILLAVAAAVWIIRKRSWWTRLFRK